MYKSLNLLILLFGLTCAQPNDTLVLTPLGPLRGKRYEFKSKFNQRSINAFIGMCQIRFSASKNSIKTNYDF
jgi:hypothetical protein